MADSNKKILIVEDNDDYLFLLKRNFEETEFEIIIAKDGEEGLAKAKEEKPDLILLDILLPKMEGTEMAVKLKESAIYTPIIYLTNVKDVERISQTVAIGGGKDDYIIKTDVPIEDIVNRIRQRLHLKPQ